jgi:hypothetical protein
MGEITVSKKEIMHMQPLYADLLLEYVISSSRPVTGLFPVIGVLEPCSVI